MTSLEGRLVLITGAAGGIGSAVARTVVAQGGKAIVHDLRRDDVQALAADLGSAATPLDADLADPHAVQQLWNDAVRVNGRVDVLVNNASYFRPLTLDAPLEEWIEVWDRTLAVNLVAPSILCREAVRSFAEQTGGGIIVNVASVTAFRGALPDFWHYGAAKGGIVAMTRTIARFYGRHGVTAFVVAPGFRAPDIVARLQVVAGLLIWSFILFPVPLRLLRRHISAIINERFDVAGGGGMMARMLTQVPLPLLPPDAAEIAPGVGVVAGPDGGGVVWVHGLATFAWDAGDEAARRLAAVQLVQLKAATQVQVAEAFGVIPVSVWRWARALAGGGVAGLVPAAKGPQRASKLTPQVIEQIRELDRHGAGKAAIAAAAGVSESSVRSVLRPARPAAGSQDAGGADGIPAGQDPAGTDADFADTGMGAAPDPEPEVLPVLPDPVPRDGERALARFGLLGEGAAPAFTPGARYPLAGLLLALPPLAGTGLLACARQVYGRFRNGFYGLEVMLVVLVFMALLREARAEGATRIPPDALGRVLGLDRAPEVKTIRRKLAELAAAGKAADLQLALARHRAAASPGTLGFLYIDGHTRAYFGKRDIQKMHLARLKFPGPATEETWVTGSAGDPLLVVMAQPSSSLAAQIRDLLPALRDIAGPGTRPVLCFDRGGWSPALFAGIADAGFDLLTYRKNDAGKDIPA